MRGAKKKKGKEKGNIFPSSRQSKKIPIKKKREENIAVFPKKKN